MSDFNNAVKYFEEKQFDKAKKILEELLQTNPEDVNLLYNLGMCYMELNQPQKAIELLDRCVQLAPHHSNAYVALGFAYTKQNDLENGESIQFKGYVVRLEQKINLTDGQTEYAISVQ